MILEKTIFFRGEKYRVALEVHLSGCLYEYQIKVYDLFDILIGTRIKRSNELIDLVELINWTLLSMEENEFRMTDAFLRLVRRLEHWDGRVSI